MTPFHWTSLEVGTLAFVGAIAVALLVTRLLERRDKREAAVSPRRMPGSRYVVADGWPAPAREVFGPLAAGRIPPRPARPVAAPVHPECLDEAAVAADANLLIAAAVSMCRRDAEVRANTALMDEYATNYPMKIRPRLVDRQAETDINPLSGDLS